MTEVSQDVDMCAEEQVNERGALWRASPSDIGVSCQPGRESQAEGVEPRILSSDDFDLG